MEQLICKRCVLDKSAQEIVFDKQGICNFCHQARKALKEIELEKQNLLQIRRQVKKDGEDKQYNILLGLSGGADSSTALHHAVDLGLRPLTFSVDNGYNDPRADENIMRMVETLKVPFYRYTIDLVKFKELQVSFIKAGVPNIEIPTDHLIMAVAYEIAEQYGIKWIVSGGNVATESIMPESWGYNARDLVHIEAIHGEKVEDLPTCSLWKWNVYRWDYGIRIWYLLDYLDYNREESIAMLEKKYGWKNYSEKHCENTFTWWFQNYYLFEKFGYDKRKAHLSSLINSGQMSRSEAMEILKQNPVYPKIGLEDKIWKYPKRSHDEFAKDEKLYNAIAETIKELEWK
jgi:N-acetyl sugar amidotransferase